jgi:peroxiredoxin
LRSFQQRIPELESGGIQVVAISVDPPDINRRQRQKLGCTYTFLSDPKAEVIRRYDLLHRGAGPNHTDMRARQSFSLIPPGPSAG